jgi:hypothetical protein
MPPKAKVNRAIIWGNPIPDLGDGAFLLWIVEMGHPTRDEAIARFRERWHHDPEKVLITEVVVAAGPVEGGSKRE